MYWLYLAPSVVAAVYLLHTLVQLKRRAVLPALVLALMLANHVSRILWLVVTHKPYDEWDVVFNWVSAALCFLYAFYFKRQQRA